MANQQTKDLSQGKVLCLKQSKTLFGILRGEIQQDQQCVNSI